MFIISISFLTNCQSINIYLVMCLSDSAMAYSAITVFPAEVWAAINTLSWFSRCNIACFWNTSNSNGHWNEIIKTFCQFFFYYKILITVVSPVIWPQALFSINWGALPHSYFYKVLGYLFWKKWTPSLHDIFWYYLRLKYSLPYGSRS